MSFERDATLLLKSACAGNPDAPSKLLPLVYDELRRMARAYLVRERRNHTLQATELVHEAYLRLVDLEHIQWQGRAHFRAVAATAMRRILVDHARRRGRLKRQGGGQKVPLDSGAVISSGPDESLLALEEVLCRLASLSPRRARVVELRFFGGLSVDEAAEVLGVSPRTVDNDWTFAKTWLHREMMRGSST